MRPIFVQKMKTVPPKVFGAEVAVIRAEVPFELRISAEKSVSISMKTFLFLEINCFRAEKPFELLFPGRKIRLNFGEDLFFLILPVFGRKNCLNFRFRPKNLSQFR